MNLFKSLLAFLFVFVSTLFTASDAQAFALGNHVGGFFLGTLDHAEQNDLGTRDTCWENGWLSYDTTSGYCVATKRVSPSGVPFSSNPNKTTTILGRWDPDMKPIIGDVTGNLKSWDFGGNPGGFNVLNVPDGAMRLGDFWGTFNKPFLNAAKVLRAPGGVMQSQPIGCDLPSAFE